MLFRIQSEERRVGKECIILDYYTKDIVTCTSDFSDPTEDSDRQRNLQHFVEFRELSEDNKIIELNTGSNNA